MLSSRAVQSCPMEDCPAKDNPHFFVELSSPWEDHPTDEAYIPAAQAQTTEHTRVPVPDDDEDRSKSPFPAPGKRASQTDDQ